MSKSNYFSGKYIFGQLISLIDDKIIKSAIKKCSSDRYVKRFTTKDHLISMLFCYFSKCNWDAIYQLINYTLKLLNFSSRYLLKIAPVKNKIYSLHEPDVLCISKGKEHKKYEFGNKVSIVMTQNTGVIVGAMGFRNEFDGHTLTPALEQVNRLVGKEPKTASADRGYRGNTQIGSTKVHPQTFQR